MNENAARVDWAGLGVGCRGGSSRRAGCAWRSAGRSARRRSASAVDEVAAWCAEHDGPARAADLVEAFGADRAARPLNA